MARDDDQESGSLAKTARSMRSLGHGTSGGHHPSVARPGSRNQITRKPSWADDDGDDMSASYVYEEYPKHVTVEGKLFVCNNQAEEDQARATGSLVKEADERKRLIALAEVKGVQIDRRWALDRIAKALTDAGYDASMDPFK